MNSDLKYKCPKCGRTEILRDTHNGNKNFTIICKCKTVMEEVKDAK